MRIACWQAALVGLAACATPVSPPPEAPTLAASIEGAAVPKPAGPVRSAPARLAVPPLVQDQDYSPSGMFGRTHGEFMAGAFRYRPEVTATYLQQQDANVQNEDGHFDLDHFRFDAQVPAPVSPDTFLIVGGTFDARDYDFSDNVSGAFDEELFQAGLHLGFGTFFEDHDDFLLTGVFSPGVYSDLDGGLHSRDWKFFGEVLGTWRSQEDLFFKLGVMHSEDFRDANVLPLLGMSWRITPSVRFDTLLPKYIELSWSATERTIVHAGVDLEGEQYRVRSSVATGKQMFDVQTQEIRARLGLIQRFNDNFSLFADVGTNVAGDYKWRDTTGATYDGTLRPEIFLHVGVGIDF